MLILSSPSGAGKTTLGRLLIEGDAGLHLSVSVTTRLPRLGETNGKDYFFIDRTRFAALRETGRLLEWAEVFGNFYGTPRVHVAAMLAAGKDILFDIDWQGARSLREAAPGDVVSVFILPPSRAALAERLHKRASDSEETVRRRLAGAAEEIRHWEAYDYVIVNEDLEASLEGLRAILAAERLRRTRRTGLGGFVAGLLDES